MKGCYCLIIYLENCELEIGKLGKIHFEKGYYVYVGSAMNSLKSRVNRHLNKDKKTHWHIDYLLKSAEIQEVIFNISDEKIECQLSRHISRNGRGIENFGCSDCNCKSHLYYFKNRKEAIEQTKNAYDSIAMNYYDLNYFKEI